MGQGEVAAALDRLRDAGCQPGETAWLDAGKAADLFFTSDAVAARAALTGVGEGWT